VLCLCSEKFKQCLTVVHRQSVTSPVHVEQGYRGQTLTLTLSTAETSGKFCFLISSAARSKQFMKDLTGFSNFIIIFMFVMCLFLAKDLVLMDNQRLSQQELYWAVHCT